MEKEIFRFKTNINCSGCVSKVESDLNQASGIEEWDVDISNSEKVLTVKSDGISEDEITHLIAKKGFSAEPIHI